jgi:uncharacterized coiled-coil protein SlyX
MYYTFYYFNLTNMHSLLLALHSDINLDFCSINRNRKSRWRQNYCLISAFLVACLFFPLGIRAQFIPGLYSNVKSEQNYEFSLIRNEPLGMIVDINFIWSQDGTAHTISIWVNDQLIETILYKWRHKGYEHIAGWAGRVISGPLNAGTKVLLKARLDAPENPGARLLSLSVRAISYDSIHNLTRLKNRVDSLERLQLQVGQNADKIAGLDGQLSTLKTGLNAFRQQMDALALEHSQFKADINQRLNSLDTRIRSVENNLKNLSQQLNAHQVASDQSKTQVASRFGAIDRTLSEANTNISSLKDHYKALKATDVGVLDQLATLEKRSHRGPNRPNNLLGLIGTSVGSTAALLAGGAFYQLVKSPIPSRQKKNINTLEWDLKKSGLDHPADFSKLVSKEFK